MSIPVYMAEREAGVAAMVAASSAVYASAVRLSGKVEVSAKVAEYIRAVAGDRARASLGDMDLHYLDTIMVTTGWNLNDDVFDSLETWVARHTPTHKQLNNEHDCAQIVGHIISSRGVDDSGKEVSEDASVEELPVKFHLVTGGVLYKYWEKPELQERMDAILAKIVKGELFVSMECLFKGFDYALKAADGSTRVVARNAQTSFLTKHLRAYGGSGQYGEDRVGRLLRNIVFSGKGLVEQPANPESLILPEQTQVFSVAHALLLTDFQRAEGSGVYSPGEAHKIKQESKTTMSVEIDTITGELRAAKAEIEKLKSGQQETVVNELKAKLAMAEAKNAESDVAVKAAADVVTKASEEKKKEISSLQAKLDEVVKDLAEAKDELGKLYTEQRVKDRLHVAKSKLGMSEAIAAAFVSDNDGLSDEKFTKQVETILAAKGEWATNNAQPGNTAFPAPSAKTPPKSTDKPLPPKSTPKPLPQAKGSEEDVEGEVTADNADLSSVEPSKGAALSTRITDAGVTDVSRDIAGFFDCEVEDE